MSKPIGPTSPLSSNSNDSGYHSRYDGPTLSNATYAGGPYAASRPPPPRPSPPSSNHPSSSTDMSRPSAAGSSVGGGRPPSSASSIGQQSNYGGGRASGPPRPPMPADRKATEEQLQQHYATLKVYLASTLQDEKGNIKPNRARDKLLRLSPTQFMELSTDVYDELIRREDDRLNRVPNVPRSLPPKSTFHPKRNQARQKLSTLPLERFRQLATDVFYELERRIPRVANGLEIMDRPGSAASVRSRGSAAPRPPPPPGMRGPPGGPGPRGPPGGFGGYPPQSPGFPPGARPPQPKTFQSSTIIPNKGTMVEDDDEDEEVEEDEDAFGLDRVMSGFGTDRKMSSSQNYHTTSHEDRKRLEDQDMEIAELRRKVDGLEHELAQAAGSSGQHDEWTALREELEQKNLDAQRLNDDLRRELDQLHRDKTADEREIRAQHDRSLGDLRAQLDNMHSQTDDLQEQLRNHRAEKEELRVQLEQGQGHAASQSENEKRIQILEAELATQEKLTNEVRNEAMTYLKEMKDLSRQNDRVVEQEEKLASQVSKMEKEIDEWRHRYARVKVQNNSLRASTMGLNLQTSSFDATSLFRGNEKQASLISQDGLVKDVDISRFQLSIDELVQVARQNATQPMLDSVKNVVVTVQAITSSVGGAAADGYPTPSSATSPLSPQSNNNNNTGSSSSSVAKLKSRVTASANALITATKQHSAAMGLSPVALLDAAASNLSAAIVELVKSVGVRPSPKSELQQLEQQHQHQHNPMLDGSLDVDSPSNMASFYDDSNSPNEHDDERQGDSAFRLSDSYNPYGNSHSSDHNDYYGNDDNESNSTTTGVNPYATSAAAGGSGGGGVNGVAIQVQPPPPPSESATSSYAERIEHERQLEREFEAEAQAQSPAVAAAVAATSSEKPKPAPLNLGGLGRSNTMKKWFGWGRSASSGGDEPPGGASTPIATTPMTAVGHGSGSGEGEFDDFR